MDINSFSSQLTFGGARPTLFRVQIQNPVNNLGDIKVPFMVKAAQLPQLSQGTVEIPYMGRKIKRPGDRTYMEWTVTVINDEDFLIRNALEQWLHAMNSPAGNTRSVGQILSQAQVTQLSKQNLPLRTYNFVNLWPSEVGPIDLSWETPDSIEEYTVTFQYDYWDVVGGITGNAGGR